MRPRIHAAEGMLYHIVRKIRPALAERIAKSDHLETLIIGLGGQGSKHAGLMHDFGIILLDEFFAPIFQKIMEESSNSGAHFAQKELEVLDIIHNDVVKELFTNWKLPENITEAIVNHYSIYEEEIQLDSDDKKISLCVAAGNLMAKAFALGVSCDLYVYPLNNWVFQAFKMSTGPTEDFLEEIKKDQGNTHWTNFVRAIDSPVFKVRSMEE